MQPPPARLWIVRHGESAGNVAWQTAEAMGHHLIDVSARDADVPLSTRGERQAAALGRWFKQQPPDQHPTCVYSSPYLRAHETARLALAAAGLDDVPFFTDERLREKEFGAINRMTKAGIVATMPEQAELRRTLGKFYYRPPGGESWCDILLRLRSLWGDIRRDHGGERVLLICHSVVTLCFRVLIEGLQESDILAIDASNDIANCALTSYVASNQPSRAGLVLETFNFVAPLEDAGEPVTRKPDPPRPK